MHLENLEARDVPAIILPGTFANGTTTATGGTVTVAELAGGIYAVLDKAQTNPPTVVSVSGTADDTISLSLNGTTLTITDSDGIFVRDQTGKLVSVGTSLDVQSVTGLNVNLDQGGNDNVTLNGTGTLTATINAGPGNDTVTDNSSFTTIINGGDGNDILKATGGAINPLLLQLLQQPGGINPSLFPLLMGMTGQKTILGGAGDDNITGPVLGFFDTLDGGDGNDTIIGGFGPDFIIGGTGFDIIAGLGGQDIIFTADGGADFILNQRNDVVISDALDLLAVPIRGRGNAFGNRDF